MSFFFLTEDTIVNLTLLELINGIGMLVEVDGVFARLMGLPVIRVEDGPFKKQTQTGSLGNGDLIGAVSLDNPLGITAAAHDHGSHGDHLADLVHHETLAMDLEAEPLGAVDDDGLFGHLEGLDVTF